MWEPDEFEGGLQDVGEVVRAVASIVNSVRKYHQLLSEAEQKQVINAAFQLSPNQAFTEKVLILAAQMQEAEGSLRHLWPLIVSKEAWEGAAWPTLGSVLIATTL